MNENTEQPQALCDEDILAKYEILLLKNIDQYGILIPSISAAYLPAPKEQIRGLLENSSYDVDLKCYLLNRLEAFCEDISLEATLTYVEVKCSENTLIFIVWWLFFGQTMLWLAILPIFMLIVCGSSVMNTSPMTIMSGSHKSARLTLLYVVKAFANLSLSISYFFISFLLLCYIGLYHLYVFSFVNFSLLGLVIALWSIRESRNFAINMGVFLYLSELAGNIARQKKHNGGITP